MSKKEPEVEAMNEAAPVESQDNVSEDTPDKAIGTPIDDDLSYCKIRDNEMKDALAIQVLNLTNDTHTGELKAVAAKHILERFK